MSLGDEIMGRHKKSFIIKKCMWGSIVGFCWGLLWVCLLIFFNLHQLMWTVNAPLLKMYEKIIYIFISPDAIPIGLLLLLFCFTLTGLFGGFIIACTVVLFKKESR